MWSDIESNNDYLNFGEVSNSTVNILKSKHMLPISIGIFGNWGAGKSTILKLIESELSSSEDDWIIINFNSWLYHGYDDARASLLEKIASTLNDAAKANETLFVKTQKLLKRVDGFRLLGLLGEGAAIMAGVPTGGLISRGMGAVSSIADGIKTTEEFDAISGTVKEVKNTTQGLIKPEIEKTPPQQIDEFRNEYEEILTEIGKPLVVIIDNLDRCLPKNAIQTLEAIRLFLFLKNTAFIIAADEEMIRSSVAEHFKGSSTRHQIDYIDKLIQIPIRVPKAGIREIRSYLYMLYAVDYGISETLLNSLRENLEESLMQAWKDEPISKDDAIKIVGEDQDSPLYASFELADRITSILTNSPKIHGNPRIVKRLLNVVKIRTNIAKRHSMPMDEAIITKLVIFERCTNTEATSDLYKLVDNEFGKPKIFKQIENKENSNLPEDVPESWKQSNDIKSFIHRWAQTEPSLDGVDLRGAIYLSRETLPISLNVTGLSQNGKKAIEILLKVTSINSPAAKEAISLLNSEEYTSVIEGIIDSLRQIQDWTKSPQGILGGCILANYSEDVAVIFSRYIRTIEINGKKPAWLSLLLKNEKWFKGE